MLHNASGLWSLHAVPEAMGRDKDSYLFLIFALEQLWELQAPTFSKAFLLLWDVEGSVLSLLLPTAIPYYN